jgi:hypothetical protein
MADKPDESNQPRPVIPKMPRAGTPPGGTQQIPTVPPAVPKRPQSAVSPGAPPAPKPPAVPTAPSQKVPPAPAAAPASEAPTPFIDAKTEPGTVPVFGEAAVHVAYVRGVMLEVRYGLLTRRWLEVVRPAWRLMIATAQTGETRQLLAALRAFSGAMDTAIASSKNVASERGELGRYCEPLIALDPKAFDVDAERERREPAIVAALLGQVTGIERPAFEKLGAVGLDRLEAFAAVTAADIAAMAGLGNDLAVAIVERFEAYRLADQGTLAAPDPTREREQLSLHLTTLRTSHEEFVRASQQWTDETRLQKRALRRQRELASCRVKLALARLGETELVARIEKLPFASKIIEIDQLLVLHAVI